VCAYLSDSNVSRLHNVFKFLGMLDCVCFFFSKYVLVIAYIFGLGVHLPHIATRVLSHYKLPHNHLLLPSMYLNIHNQTRLQTHSVFVKTHLGLFYKNIPTSFTMKSS
jgi:hypothetical protein